MQLRAAELKSGLNTCLQRLENEFKHNFQANLQIQKVIRKNLGNLIICVSNEKRGMYRKITEKVKK